LSRWLPDVWFSADNLVLLLIQAACVVLPAAGLPAWADRFRGSGWALVLPVSVVAVVTGISLLPATADALTWMAFVGVPIGGALALGWAARGSRIPLASFAAPLMALAWVVPDTEVGQLAAAILVAGSAITLGRLLAGATPLGWLKAGVYALAFIDAFLVFSGSLQGPNEVLVTAAPGPGLPQLQSASFGTMSIGYGDFLIAAVVGAILAAEGRRQLLAGAATLVFSLVWDQLFLVYEVLPATIPPALALLAAESIDRLTRADIGRRGPGSRWVGGIRRANIRLAGGAAGGGLGRQPREPEAAHPLANDPHRRQP
jgi:hypothetical protein